MWRDAKDQGNIICVWNQSYSYLAWGNVAKHCPKHLRLVICLILKQFVVVVYCELFYCRQIFRPRLATSFSPMTPSWAVTHTEKETVVGLWNKERCWREKCRWRLEKVTVSVPSRWRHLQHVRHACRPLQDVSGSQGERNGCRAQAHRLHVRARMCLHLSQGYCCIDDPQLNE